MEKGLRKYQVYDFRSGTKNNGLTYELKIATLFCLRNSSPDTTNMWLAVNVKGCGNFDDIIMHRKTENDMNTYLIQLKHEEKQTDIKLGEFTNKVWNNKKSNFYFLKYFESISESEDLINPKKLSKQATQTADTSTTMISLFQQNFDNIIYIIFTNRGTSTEYDLLKEDTTNAEMLRHINTGGKIFQFDYKKLNLGPEQDFGDYNEKMFLFAYQIHVDNLDLEIENELRDLICPLKLTANQISRVYQDLKTYIDDWSKGDIGGSYIITKTDILKVLSELLLSPYMVKIKEFRGQSEFELKMWKNLEKHYSTIFVEVNHFIKEYLQVYINTEVNNFLKDFKNKGILQKDPDDVKRRLLKAVTNLNDNTFSDLAYEYQWKNNELPLLVEVKDTEELENVKNILRISQNVFRVIVLNKSTIDILHKNILGGSVITLNDLTKRDQTIVLECPVILQGGRSAIKLSECFNKDIFQFVRVKEIIQIFTGKFCIGNKLEPLPEIFITRSLQSLYLRGEVLRNVENDKFVIKCNSMSSFEKFLENHRLYIDSSLITSVKATRTNFKILGNPKIYIVEREEPINEIYRTSLCTNVHFLLLQNDTTILWVKSIGTNKNIVPFLIKPEQYTFSNLEKTSYTITESQIPKLISASPGMGKSILIDYIALNASQNVWVLRINLSDHSEYYASDEFKNSHSDPSKHLFNFNNRILNKRENINDLSKKVFEKYLLSKKILVLLDGFDETPVDYKDEVTKMLQSLNNFEYPLCITTRPVFKDHLEKLLGTFAISINPFSKDDQINYLTEYFTKHINCSQSSENVVKTFVERLLKLANKNLSKRDEGFTGIPLQTNLLAQVYEGHCESFLNSNEFVNDHFDLLYLYKTFIEKKSEIFCKRYGSNVCNVPHCSKRLRSFYSLKLLFPKEDISTLNIDDYLDEMRYSVPNLIRYFQKDGIIAVVRDLNASFIHRTFAEYLAAEWLAENISGRYKDRVKILIKKIFDPNFTLVRIFFDQILANDCNLHLAIINHQVEKARNIITTASEELSKTDKGGRTFLHLIAAWGIYHPVKYDIEKDLGGQLVFTAIRDDMFVILNLVPNDKLDGTNRDILLDYTSLDYALATNSLCIADYICAKLQNLDQRVFSITEDINYIKQYLNIFSYGSLGSVVIMHDIVKDLNSPLLFNEKGDSGKGDLHWAVIKGHLEKIKQLLENDADINAIDNNKMTALHYALIVTLNNQPEILTLLLSKGANVGITDGNGKTPLHYAVNYNQIENLKLLLEHNKRTTSFGASSGVLLHTDTDGSTVLHSAAEKGHTKILALLLNHGANVNVGDNNGHTPLHWASAHGHIETVDFLIKNEADIEAKDKLQRTPLIVAGIDGRTSTIKFLLSKKANLRAKDYIGCNVLHRAARNGHEETVRFLISEGTLIGTKNNEWQTPLQYSSHSDDTKISEPMLSVNESNGDINNQDTKGLIGFHLARSYGRTETVKHLVSTKTGKYGTECFVKINSILFLKETNIDMKNFRGETSLHLAATRGHRNIVELLLSYGANEKSVTAINETVLHKACAGGNNHIIALLLDKGANLEAQDNQGARTPLIRAVRNGKIDAVKLLLDKGVNIEVGDSSGDTPLVYAIYYGHTAIAELFLSLGADIRAKGVHNMTALHWACYCGRTDIAVLLLPKEPDLEKVDKYNRTFLYCAALHGHADTVKFLLSKGASKTARNIEGLTPLDIAVKKGYEDVVNVLLEE